MIVQVASSYTSETAGVITNPAVCPADATNIYQHLL